MARHQSEKLAKPSKASHKTPLWKRLQKITLRLLLLTILICAAFVGALVFKYHRIVGAKPGALQTNVKATEHGRWVNPFIGTGGIPWVCGNNFPGAMTPFGMVRLGPETISFLNRERALNTSGYYYGDDRVLGRPDILLLSVRNFTV